MVHPLPCARGFSFSQNISRSPMPVPCRSISPKSSQQPFATKANRFFGEFPGQDIPPNSPSISHCGKIAPPYFGYAPHNLPPPSPTADTHTTPFLSNSPKISPLFVSRRAVSQRYSHPAPRLYSLVSVHRNSCAVVEQVRLLCHRFQNLQALPAIFLV